MEYAVIGSNTEGSIMSTGSKETEEESALLLFFDVSRYISIPTEEGPS
jgi:hypothetical protein